MTISFDFISQINSNLIENCYFGIQVFDCANVQTFRISRKTFSEAIIK